VQQLELGHEVFHGDCGSGQYENIVNAIGDIARIARVRLYHFEGKDLLYVL
jgi:hypothetical protein